MGMGRYTHDQGVAVMSTESEMRAILQELHEKFNMRVYGASSYIKRDMRDRIEAVLAAAPQAPSGQQAEPRTLAHDAALSRAYQSGYLQGQREARIALAAATKTPEPAPAGQAEPWQAINDADLKAAEQFLMNHTGKAAFFPIDAQNLANIAMHCIREVRATRAAAPAGQASESDIATVRDQLFPSVWALAAFERILAASQAAPAGQAVKDAARYRVLREHQHGFRAYRLQPKQGKRWRGWSDEGAILKGDELDAAIDAALAASQAERPAVKERNPSPKGMSDE